jgi:poly(3-hydroxybutyrate) depolymerase
MRHALLAVPLVVAACSSTPGVVTDGGAPPLACYIPADGGVFVSGLQAPVPGCIADAGPTGELDLAALGWLPSGGIMVVPPEAAAGTAVPVVLVFHGSGGTGAEARSMFNLEVSADAGVIFVYPDAAAQMTWDIRPVSADGHNVDKLIRQLSQTYCIDPARIYMAGFSAGAVFTLYLGCNVPGTFRGMASVAGADDRFELQCCHSGISGIFIHGTQDDTITIVEGTRALVTTLVRDKCDPNALTDDASCQRYSCPVPYAVDFCEWNGDHDVPPFAGAEIIRFFGL